MYEGVSVRVLVAGDVWCVWRGDEVLMCVYVPICTYGHVWWRCSCFSLAADLKKMEDESDAATFCI